MEKTSNWVTESGHGFGLTLEIKEKLYSRQSRYQKIEVFQTMHYGRMLMLDGVIQLTEFDEFAYQEMLAHVPLFAHPDPKSVLVIGGGDGGVLREVAKHPSVERIDICEIDAEVIAAAKKFLPTLSRGFDDPRVRLHIGDGAKFVAECENRYDVVIVDSSDPVGPNEPLFNAEFYANVRNILNANGVVASQSESYYLFWAVVEKLTRIFRKVFGNSEYFEMLVPTYPGGCIGACVATADGRFPSPVREPENMPLKYYSSAVHRAAFVLPVFAEKMLKEVR